MEEQYKKLYEITERENQSLTELVEMQKRMIEDLTQENETLKTAFKELSEQLETVLGICDRQQQVLDEIMENSKG